MVASPPVTILWVGVASAPPAAEIEAAVAASVELDALPAAVMLAMARGGVVAVVADAAAADLALSIGVDEVVRHGASSAEVQRAVETARLRAAARAARDGRLADELFRADGEALEILGAAVAHELRTPLAVASLNSDILAEALETVTLVADEATRWAEGDRGSPAELDRLTSLRGSAPPTAEITASVQDLSTALRRATQVVRRMSALTSDEAQPTCDLGEALSKVESIMRGLIERSASFVVSVPREPCLVAFPRWQLMQTMAALLANANEATTAKLRAEGTLSRIEMSLSFQPWVAVVEVHDTGLGMTPDVSARALHPFFTTHRPGSLGLGLTVAAARVRRAGGELMLESEPGQGTRVRVFLPLASEPTPEEPPTGAWDRN